MFNKNLPVMMHKKEGAFAPSTRRLATVDTDFTPHLDFDFNLGHAGHLPFQKIYLFCIF